MPLSYECKQKHIKQNPWKPAKSKRTEPPPPPGPTAYELPELVGGKGFSHIKRSPAYSFGLKTVPFEVPKPILTKDALLFNIRGFNKRGKVNVTHGFVSPRIHEPEEKVIVPGPGAYEPANCNVTHKRAPAYTMQARTRPPQTSKQMWTPSANIYCPPIPGKRTPAYGFGKSVIIDKIPDTPGPGVYDPNFKYVVKNSPQVVFGEALHIPEKIHVTPGPGDYCSKKVMHPGQSFGIKHTPYLGEITAHIKPSKLNATGGHT